MFSACPTAAWYIASMQRFSTRFFTRVLQQGHSSKPPLQITALTAMTLRLASMAENSFNAVERVAEYADLPAEPQGGCAPPPGWPSKGQARNGAQCLPHCTATEMLMLNALRFPGRSCCLVAVNTLRLVGTFNTHTHTNTNPQTPTHLYRPPTHTSTHTHTHIHTDCV